MQIEYTAHDKQDRRVTGRLEADSEQIAEDLLWENDLIVDRLRRIRQRPSLHAMFPTLFGVKQRETIALVRQLAVLLDSGLPLLLSLQALSPEGAHPMIKAALRGMTQRISEGGQFSDGLADYPSIFPSIFVRLARIGEQTGELSDVLRRGADYLETQAAVKSKLQASMTYPAIVFVTAGISVVILVKFSIPMLSGLLEEFGADLPLITRLIVGLSDLVGAIGLYVAVVLVVSVVSFVLFRRREAGRLITDRYLLRAPMLGSLVMKSSIARVTQTLTSLLQSGIPLLEAVQLTKDNTENAYLREELEGARLALLSGTNFSDSLSEQHVFPPMLVEVVRVGESAGNMADQLEVISRVYQLEFEASVNRMVALIEPAMILLVGGVVAVIGVTVITTVYSILPEIT